MGAHILETLNLTKKFGDFTAVDDLNINIEKGEIFGLLGPNGAGKTTTINMLTGLILPTSGTAKVCGYDIIEQPLEARRRIGLLPDNAGNYDNLTAAQNLSFFAELADVPKNVAKERMEQLLSLVGLTEWRDMRVEKYSKGMKQRLGVAQSLVRDPDLLFYDEPTQGIDPEGTLMIRELVRKLADEGKSLLITTHMLNEANRVCDRVAVMRRGKVVATGTVEELKKKFDVSSDDLTEIFMQIQRQTTT